MGPGRFLLFYFDDLFPFLGAARWLFRSHNAVAARYKTGAAASGTKKKNSQPISFPTDFTCDAAKVLGLIYRLYSVFPLFLKAVEDATREP